jgi:hypothetical protein
MTKTQKSIRPSAAKMSRDLRSEMNETTLGSLLTAYPENLPGVLKPLSPVDSTLFRLIERIKNL